jgi:AcrR family transcriptional regulator
MSRVQATATRREAIQDAALRCFAEYGYEATTVHDIVRESDASVGSLYHHFGDKLGIAAAVHAAAIADYHRGALAILDAGLGTERTIRDGVAYHLAWIEANPTPARFVFVQREADIRLAAKPEVRELNRHFFRRVSEWLAEARAAGEVRDLPDQVFQSLWIGPSLELGRGWLTGQYKQPLTAATGDLADGAWRVVRPEDGVARRPLRRR